MPGKSVVRSLTLTAMGLVLAASSAQAETLKEALAKAYQNNPSLSAARAQQRATDEDVPISKADGRPSASLSGEYEDQLHRQFPAYSAKRNATGAVSLSVPLYSGGAVRNAVKAAEARAASGLNDLRGTESAIFSAVVAAYMDVIRDGAIVALNRQLVKSLEVNLQASSDRFEVGDLTRTDVAQSESRLALARADLQSAEARLIASKENYISLVGSPPDALATPAPLPGLPDTVETAVAIALKDNPDILAAQQARDAAHYQVKVAKAQNAPRVSAFASGSYVDYLNSEPAASYPSPTPSTKSAAAGLQLTMPIYQGGRPAALQRQSVARESASIEQMIGVERDVIAQTRAAYASWQAALQTIVSTRKAVESSALSLEGVKAENSVGTRTILDILNAEQEALNARVQLVAAERDAYVAAFTLLAAMGHAEARDLQLDIAAPYDAPGRYKQVRGKWFDYDYAATPQAQSTRTVDTPAQTADLPPVNRP